RLLPARTQLHLLFPHRPPSTLPPLSLPDALPISIDLGAEALDDAREVDRFGFLDDPAPLASDAPATDVEDLDGGLELVVGDGHEDRKSTRLNSRHVKISDAACCSKKKTTKGGWPG